MDLICAGCDAIIDAAGDMAEEELNYRSLKKKQRSSGNNNNITLQNNDPQTILMKHRINTKDEDDENDKDKKNKKKKKRNNNKVRKRDQWKNRTNHDEDNSIMEDDDDDDDNDESSTTSSSSEESNLFSDIDDDDEDDDDDDDNTNDNSSKKTMDRINKDNKGNKSNKKQNVDRSKKKENNNKKISLGSIYRSNSKNNNKRNNISSNDRSSKDENKSKEIVDNKRNAKESNNNDDNYSNNNKDNSSSIISSNSSSINNDSNNSSNVNSNMNSKSNDKDNMSDNMSISNGDDNSDYNEILDCSSTIKDNNKNINHSNSNTNNNNNNSNSTYIPYSESSSMDQTSTMTQGEEQSSIMSPPPAPYSPRQQEEWRPLLPRPHNINNHMSSSRTIDLDNGNNKSNHNLTPPTFSKLPTTPKQQQQQQSPPPQQQSSSSSARAEESSTLKSILQSSNTTTQEFFDQVYQKQCALFHFGGNEPQQHSRIRPSNSSSSRNNSNNNAAAWDKNKMKTAPFEECVHQGWNILVHLLDEVKLNKNEDQQQQPAVEQQMKQIIQPLFFKGQCPLPQDDDKLEGFQQDLFKAYLDGCNIVFNHADLSSPWIATLCDDLTKSFPHAFANGYLTPPASQAVKPHSDDRDVFVIQLTGAKHWKVYQRIPIPYPYPQEQVGKETVTNHQTNTTLKVPTYVFEGPLLVDTTLRPGDVLYMPRGYVHEARGVPFVDTGTNGDKSGSSNGIGRTTTAPSFHITIALATHDWTLGRVMSQATEQLLMSSSTPVLRRAISRSIGREDDNNVMDTTTPSHKELQQQIDDTFAFMKQQITAQTIHALLQEKYSRHNQQAYYFRQKQLDKITKTMLEQEKKAKKLRQLKNTVNYHSDSSSSTRTNNNISATNNHSTNNVVAIVGIQASQMVSIHTIVRIATDYEKSIAIHQLSQTSQSQQLQQRGLQVREEIADGIIQILSELKKHPHSQYRVCDLRILLAANHPASVLICDLALLSFVKQCVAQGALAIVV